MKALVRSLRLPALAGTVAFATLLATPAAQAVTETDSVQLGTGAGTFTPTFAAPANDLLLKLAPDPNTVQPSVADFAQEGSGGIPVLTDGAYGTIGAPGGANTHPAFATGGPYGGGGTMLTYTLTQPSSINSIVTLGGWNDNGRDSQAYSVSYQVGGAGNFTTLATVNFNPNAPNNTQAATQVVLDGFGTIDNVTAIQFNFVDAQNGYQGYAELAVTGVVPEPSTWAAMLGSMCVLGLTLYRRARRA